MVCRYGKCSRHPCTGSCAEEIDHPSAASKTKNAVRREKFKGAFIIGSCACSTQKVTLAYVRGAMSFKLFVIGAVNSSVHVGHGIVFIVDEAEKAAGIREVHLHNFPNDELSKQQLGLFAPHA